MSGLRPFFAAVVVLAFTVGAPQADAQRLGRLFTTPEQRSTLDEIRTQALFAEPEIEIEPEAQPALVSETEAVVQPMISNLTINGVVRRRGGRTTIWVNGHEVERGSVTREGVLVESAPRRSGDVRLRLPSGTESIALRPGQKIDIGTGMVLEPYEAVPTEATQTAFPGQAAMAAPRPAVEPAAPASPDNASASPPVAADASALRAAKVRQHLDALTRAASDASAAGAAPASP